VPLDKAGAVVVLDLVLTALAEHPAPGGSQEAPA
jgi:hypothetical protein